MLRTTTEIRRARRFCWYLRFVSVVTNMAKPADSAATSNSPFFSIDQPRSNTVDTSCCVRNRRNGTGVPWSKEYAHSGSGQAAARCVFEHGTRLLQGHAGKPLDELRDLGAILEILEKRRDGHSRTAEHPRTAYALGVSFDSGA